MKALFTLTIMAGLLLYACSKDRECCEPESPEAKTPEQIAQEARDRETDSLLTHFGIGKVPGIRNVSRYNLDASGTVCLVGEVEGDLWITVLDGGNSILLSDIVKVNDLDAGSDILFKVVDKDSVSNGDVFLTINVIDVVNNNGGLVGKIFASINASDKLAKAKFVGTGDNQNLQIVAAYPWASGGYAVSFDGNLPGYTQTMMILDASLAIITSFHYFHGINPTPENVDVIVSDTEFIRSSVGAYGIFVIRFDLRQYEPTWEVRVKFKHSHSGVFVEGSEYYGETIEKYVQGDNFHITGRLFGKVGQLCIGVNCPDEPKFTPFDETRSVVVNMETGEIVN